MKYRRGIASVLTRLAPAVLAFMWLVTAHAKQPSPELVQDLLSENWTAVWERLGADRSEPEPAVLRLIKGHACLALNRNNQSLALFASALNDEDRRSWKEWAGWFASNHPNKAVAWYLQGDAHARSTEWKEAAECLDRAIGLDPQCYLALNARGVVETVAGMTLKARMYFLKSSQARPDFADAYASRGTLNVNAGHARRTTKPGDRQSDFNRAAQLSQDRMPLLATVGMACDNLLQQDYDQAKRHFDAIPEDMDFLQLTTYNQLVAEIETLHQLVRRAADVGMSLQAFRQVATSPEVKATASNEIEPDTNVQQLHTPEWLLGLLLGYNIFVSVIPNVGEGPLEPVGSEIQEVERLAEERAEAAEGAGAPPINPENIDYIVTVRRADDSVIYVIYMKDGSVWVYDPQTNKWKRIKEPDRRQDEQKRWQASAITVLPLRTRLELIDSPLDPNLAAILQSVRGPMVFIASGPEVSPPQIQAIELRPQDIAVMGAINSAMERYLGAYRQSIAAKPMPAAPPSARHPGGVDSDPRKIAANRGNFPVLNVFGLLYPAPVEVAGREFPKIREH